jgi:hypothetical protein
MTTRKQRRSFSREYKVEAVRMATEQGHKLTQVAGADDDDERVGAPTVTSKQFPANVGSGHIPLTRYANVGRRDLLPSDCDLTRLPE